MSVANGKLVIADAAPITAGNGCTVNVQGDAECSIGVASISMFLSDKNDTVQYIAPHSGSISREDGDDIVFGALRQAASGRPIQPVFYLGNAAGTRSTTRSPTAAYAWTPTTTPAQA